MPHDIAQTAKTCHLVLNEILLKEKWGFFCTLLDVSLANQIPCCMFSFLFLRSIAASASSSATTENTTNSEATTAKGSFIFISHFPKCATDCAFIQCLQVTEFLKEY